MENLAYQRKVHSLSVDGSERACVNCRYFEQYYRANRGNVQMWVPVNAGYCLLREERRGPLRQPCEKFARGESR